MFTGLIQAIGTIHHQSSHELRVSWDTEKRAPIGSDLSLGDSISVDGVCLTVMQIVPDGFIAVISPETVSRTTLSQRQSNLQIVNLESSLRVGSKVGGHFVTGHIDGIGYLEASLQTETSWEMSFTVSDARVARYIVPKGSISVNGVSLTVADCNDTGTWFKVAVIPVTYYETNLQFLTPGSIVNLEGDVLGKYVEKFVRIQSPDCTSDVDSLIDNPSTCLNADSITSSFLAEHGYS